MQRRAPLSRPVSFIPENLGQNALQLISNFRFALFLVGVLVFAIIAATYHPGDTLYPSPMITSFLTSTSNSTFRSDDPAAHSGEDFLSPNSSSDASSTFCADGPIDCSDPEVFHTMMRAAIEMFPNIHFYRFGKPALVAGDGKSCDMAWRFRPEETKPAGFYKDYRRFEISRSANCTYSVVKIGDYHTGINARKKRKQTESGDGVVVPAVGGTVNGSLPAVDSHAKFSTGKYLIYTSGGDRCKSMKHYLWSFLCAVGEAQHLNRTLVMDLSICLNSMYSSSNQDEEGKDFRFYFDFEHLRDSASVLDQRQFWADWEKWQAKDKLKLYLVEDFNVTPMKLAGVRDSLIMRKFGAVEPDNYWYRVCEGETESVIQRPWNLIWKCRRLRDIVSAIASRMNWDFDAVHVARGKKAKHTDALISTLRDKIDDGRHLYVAADEPNAAFFDALKERYRTHFLDDFSDLWGEDSEWYLEMMKLNSGVPVEFDGYMRVEVDAAWKLNRRFPKEDGSYWSDESDIVSKRTSLSTCVARTHGQVGKVAAVG
ncbi:hypothetical protein KSP39_PZI008188 [Platanthera zijinensis]|uniref:O-fucosyltransferase family protein n=1 Tax=Platanthera zijinensis TaxID=2320716 RepID=A0AAP0BN45_9ASPA